MTAISWAGLILFIIPAERELGIEILIISAIIFVIGDLVASRIMRTKSNPPKMAVQNRAA
jgi:hypothetical protein